MPKVLIIPYPRRYFAHELLMHDVTAGNTASLIPRCSLLPSSVYKVWKGPGESPPVMSELIVESRFKQAKNT